MEKSSIAYVGMDVRKESIEVAIAQDREARRYGKVGGAAASVDRVVRKLRSVHRNLMPGAIRRTGAHLCARCNR